MSNDNLIGNSFWKVSVICTVELEEVRTFVRNIDSQGDFVLTNPFRFTCNHCAYRMLSKFRTLCWATVWVTKVLLVLRSLCNVWKLGKHTSWEGQHSQSNNFSVSVSFRDFWLYLEPVESSRMLFSKDAELALSCWFHPRLTIHCFLSQHCAIIITYLIISISLHDRSKNTGRGKRFWPQERQGIELLVQICWAASALLHN